MNSNSEIDYNATSNIGLKSGYKCCYFGCRKLLIDEDLRANGATQEQIDDNVVFEMEDSTKGVVINDLCGLYCKEHRCRCFPHPWKWVQYCNRCNKTICKNCSFIYKELYICEDCYHKKQM